MCFFESQTTRIFVMSSWHSRAGPSSQEKGQVGQVVLRPLKEQHGHIVARKPQLFVVGGLGAKAPLFCVLAWEANQNYFLWWFGICVGCVLAIPYFLWRLLSQIHPIWLWWRGAQTTTIVVVLLDQTQILCCEVVWDPNLSCVLGPKPTICVVACVQATFDGG